MHHTPIPWAFNFRYNPLSSCRVTLGFDSPYPVQVRLVFDVTSLQTHPQQTSLPGFTHIPRLSWLSLSSAWNSRLQHGWPKTVLLKSLAASAFVHLGVLSLTASLGICTTDRTERPRGKKEAEWSQSPQLNPAFLLRLLPDYSPGWETLSEDSRRAFCPDESTHRRPGPYMRISNCGWGLLWWIRRQRTCLPMETRFDPWVRKIPPWRRKWQHTAVFLPGKSHGQRSLVGYSPWGRKRVRHNLATKQQQLGCCRLLF